MSISDDEGLEESVTEEYRALKYFTDRFGLTRHFSRHLHSEPTPEKILFLHGDGGNGKSLLMRYCRSVERQELTLQKQPEVV